jgi:DNA-binding transcriptional LysR family regulator
MNIKQLEMLVQVSRHGSFSRAAKSLGYAQSLISRSISLLETDWGDRLFERTGRGVHLTEFGRHMLPHAEALLTQNARLIEEVRGRHGVISGNVRFGILPSLTAKIIPRLFDEVSASAPGIKLQVVESLNGTLDNQLTAGLLDMAIVNRHAPCAKEDLLGKLRTYLVGRPRHPLFEKPKVEFKRLENVPLVLPVRPSALRNVLDQHARRKQVNLNIVLEVESHSAMIEVATTGKAMTILPHCGIEQEVSGGRLHAAEIVDPVLPRSISLAVTQEHPLSRAARLVHSITKELAPRLLNDTPVGNFTEETLIRSPARTSVHSPMLTV